jgi:MFS family permease
VNGRGVVGSGASQTGVLQGLLLVAMAWVGPAGGVVIAPVLPTMAHVFAAEPAVDLKIALVATAPVLVVGIASFPYGILLDRLGRRALLLAALFFYGAAGMAPVWMTSLDGIMVSRFAVGLAEGAVLTASTALLGDYFAGAERERWMAAQTGAAPLAAVGLVLLGGVLGASGWHVPFLVYGFAWLLIPPALLLLFEPDNRTMATPGSPAPASGFTWTKSIYIAIALGLSMIGFMLPLVQFSFLVTERGMSAPASIGLWSALATLGNPIGSLLYVFMPLAPARKLTIVYVLFAAGFLLMGALPTVAAVVIGSAVANIGAGIMFPTMITWLLSELPPEARGLGTGLFVTASSIGQFCGPLAIVAFDRLTGNLSRAVLTVGAICAATALIAAIRTFGRRAPPAAIQA